MSNNGSNNTLSVPFVGAGVRQDLRHLYLRFEDAKSLKIKDYAEVFREMRFDTIVKHRICPSEYVEFAEYLLQNCANYFRERNEFGEPRSLVERVFGIYTCYALYHLQPKDHICQIQITTQQLDELMGLERMLIEERNLEATACIHNLISKNAFQITLFQSTYDPATHKKYLAEEESSGSIKGSVIPFDRYISLLNNDNFGEMGCIHEFYVKAKRDLGIHEKPMCLVDKRNPIEEANSILAKHQKLLEEYRESLRRSAEEDGEPLIPVENESAGTSRSNLRNKAYTSDMKHSRNRRYLDPNMDKNFGHLATFGDLAQEILNEPIHESPEKSGRKSRKPRKRKLSTEAAPAVDDHEIASQVLIESMNTMMAAVKKEAGIDESLVGIKQNNDVSTKRIRAPKKKDPKIVEVQTSHEANTPSTSDVNDAFKSPEKSKSSPKKRTKISDQWSNKLNKLKKQEVAADKVLERLKNRIKMEESDGE